MSNLEQFGIFAPKYGLQEDLPSVIISPEYLTESSNVMVRDGMYERVKMRLKEFTDASLDLVKTPDGKKIIRWHRYIKRSTGTEYILAFTTNSVYKWDTTNKEWDRIFICSAAVTTWSVITYNDKVIATNNVDHPMVWSDIADIMKPLGESVKYLTGTVAINNASKELTGSGTTWSSNVAAGDKIFIDAEDRWYQIDTVDSDTVIQLTEAFEGSNITGKTYEAYDYVGLDLDGAGSYLTAAKFVISYSSYLMFAYTTEVGETYPQTIRWSDTSDETTWTGGNASYLEINGGDFITGLGKYQGMLMIFKEDSIHKFYGVSASALFTQSEYIASVGCQSPDSIIADRRGMLYFFGTDQNFRTITGDILSAGAISNTTKNINPGLVEYIRGTYISEYDQMWWAIPQDASSTENDLVLCYSQEGSWGKLDLAVSAFGKYGRQAAYTWDDFPYDTYEEWSWSRWNQKEAVAGFDIDLAADFSGYGFALHESEQDNATDYTGYLVISTDLSKKQSLPEYKRILWIQIYVAKESSGTLDIYIKKDNGSFPQTADASISLTGDEDILIKEVAIDVKAKSFEIKFTGDNAFKWIGAIFKFNRAGAR